MFLEGEGGIQCTPQVVMGTSLVPGCLLRVCLLVSGYKSDGIVLKFSKPACACRSIRVGF